MSGETDLRTLLTAIRPCLSKTAYARLWLWPQGRIKSPLESRFWRLSLKKEALTIVGPFHELSWHGLERSGALGEN